MLFSSPIFQNLVCLLVVISFLEIFPSRSDPRTSLSLLLCGSDSQTSANSHTKQKFLGAMDSIEETISGNELYASAFSSGDIPPMMYAFAQCYSDLSVSDCQTCVARSRLMMEACLPASSGRVFLDGCFLRYDTHNFTQEYLDPERDRVNCTSSQPTGPPLESYMYDELQSKFDEAFDNVTQEAARDGGFGAVVVKGGVVEVYGLAQCWQPLNEFECHECLVRARSSLRVCREDQEARALFTGCYLRYSTARFFDESAQEKSARGVRSRSLQDFIIVTAVFVVLTSAGGFVTYRRLSRKNSKSSFKYETLEKATDSFNESMKLGQGGAGSVFKGVLPDGRTVAVKRLFFNTRQWVDQLFNEVNLISGVQHKNLVRLLGCSIEGPESLLVYEFVPNKSLDQYLFVNNTDQILSWQQRFNIIAGMAEGLAHLHGGSGATIIHRDIKTSNVLLDKSLTPKIADFGLARGFGPGKTHTNTGIAGTLGYMAPEYLVKGQLTEKADVYAFGVVVVEVVTGKKNSAFTHGSNSTLYSVWKSYNEGTVTKVVDPALDWNFSEKQASKVLQIALLCTQAPVASRPSMSEIVQMLREKDPEVPSPKRPPFLNASFLLHDDSTKISDAVDTLSRSEWRRHGNSFGSEV